LEGCEALLNTTPQQPQVRQADLFKLVQYFKLPYDLVVSCVAV